MKLEVVQSNQLIAVNCIMRNTVRPYCSGVRMAASEAKPLPLPRDIATESLGDTRYDTSLDALPLPPAAARLGIVAAMPGVLAAAASRSLAVALDAMGSAREAGQRHAREGSLAGWGVNHGIGRLGAIRGVQ